jgi:alpha-methylacyl-CoA racemase
MSGPLAGLRVIELAGIGPGPYACMLLADLGADVLRLERADPDAAPEPGWDQLTRSRPSVALDLKHPEARALVLELATHADALVEGFRPGVAERLGVGPEDLAAVNPRLVYGRMTGWGQEGPLADRAGHDINYLAISGALWPIGRRDEPPVPPLNLVGDFGGGSLFLVVGLLAALWHARESGQGQVVDAAMVDGSASLLAMTHSFLNAGFWREERGVNILDTGAPFYEVYETRDSRYVAVGAIEAKFYAALLEGLGIADEGLPAQFDRDAWPALKRRFAEVFATRTRDEWVEAFAGLDACVTPVLSPREAPTHPHNVVRGIFSPVGDGVAPNPAPRFSRTPAQVSSPPRAAGSGTREGLAAWGVSDERVARLREAGALG